MTGFSIFLGVGVLTATVFLGQALVNQQRAETTHQLINFSDEVVLAAALLTGMLFAMMLYLIRNAYLRTQQLRATNQELQQEIVKRQQVESILREREERLRQLTENIREVFWISSPDQSQMLYVSPMYEEIWGKSCQSLYEQPGSFLDAIHPEDRDRVIAAAPKLPQGETRIWDFSSAPLGQLPAGKRLVISMAKDITERKAAEAVLRQSEERFRTSVENLLDCFGIYSAVRDQSGQIIDFQAEYVNPATCENSLMTKEQHLSQGLCELLPAHREIGLFDEYCQVVETDLPLVKESLVYEDVFGQQRLCRTYDIHVVKLGDGCVASWRDVTNRQRAEAEVSKALQRERELNELKSRIITTISHEYRTPLTTILSSAELVERYARQWTEEKNSLTSSAFKPLRNTWLSWSVTC